jgi:hypothetical protein
MTRKSLGSLVVRLGLIFFITACERRGSSPEPRTAAEPAAAAESGLWQVYDRSLKGAKYIDLTHTITPSIPVWQGFAPAKFTRTVNPQTNQPYSYKKDGFEATHYELPTDQYGTQLDPPAHWAPEYPAIDELPATYAVRPLVVISSIRWQKIRDITFNAPTSSAGRLTTAGFRLALW